MTKFDGSGRHTHYIDNLQNATASLTLQRADEYTNKLHDGNKLYSYIYRIRRTSYESQMSLCLDREYYYYYNRQRHTD